MSYQAIETPFQFRYCCWFCGEPAASHLDFPQPGNIVLDCPHPPLSLNTCAECYHLAARCKVTSIWQVREQVKRLLFQRYQKDLAIGINWTEQELANSEFAGGNFAGFQRSAWMMFEIAKARVNFCGWALILGGINIEDLKCKESEPFQFDGIEFPSINDAVIHYAKTFDLDKAFFLQVTDILGQEKFSQAVRFCRLLVGSTPNERKAALKQLRSNLNGYPI
ncbi:hypothetical protein tinsulaeT_31920 [Thalassotalea insulae]|uniref:HNH endonuclease n=1 Tax=Thalassotalea insulae TaxID=2056778 RepID=A0ABQ6GWX5_9GAMM|nr:hypothetical protein [Thalassotalea insulae]GLX79852.1 hypothetical protein tinsulaeT_31920 [Thalassotalea insulae]